MAIFDDKEFLTVVHKRLNYRRNKIVISFNGKTQSVKRWSSETGIKLSTLYKRLRKYGWSAEKSLITH